MINVVFAGTPEIAVNSIKKLMNFSDIKMQAVVTMPDRPAGRGKHLCEPPVKTCAVNTEVPCYQTPSISKDAPLIETLKKLAPDFIVTFAFGQMLSQEVLDIPKFGVINLHASLLPKYRGANPMAAALAAGEIETGITTMKTVLKMDAGDICLQEKIPITENMTIDELSHEVSERSPYLIYRTLKMIVSGNMNFIKQNENEVCFAPKFDKSEYSVNFEMSAKCIHNKVRAMSESPKINVCGKNVKLVKTCRCKNSATDCKPGEIVDICKDFVTIMCADEPLEIYTVKPESKGEIPASAWINGLRMKKGECLTTEKV